MALAREALTSGMFPAPLSLWYVSPGGAESGLLLTHALSLYTDDRAPASILQGDGTK